MKSGKDYTDENGYYVLGTTFYVDPKYTVVFKNSKDFILWEGWGNRAKCHFGRHSLLGYDIVFVELNPRWEWAAVNNASYEYYKMCEQTGIRKPPSGLRINVKDGGQSGAPMMRILSATQVFTKDNWATYLGALLWGTPIDTILKFIEPDVIIGIGFGGYDRAYQLANHELSHASHFSQVGSNYWAKYISYIVDNGAYGNGSGSYAGICDVGESWGHAMGYISEYEVYDRDKLNEPYQYDTQWFKPHPLFALMAKKVLTKKQVFDCLTSDVDTRAKLRDKLKTVYPNKAGLIQLAFDKNDTFLSTISSSVTPSLNNPVIFTVSAPTVAEVTFAGWTITPSTGWTATSTSGTTLNITFNTAILYTINANYRLSDGTSYAISESVDFSSPIKLSQIGDNQTLFVGGRAQSIGFRGGSPTGGAGGYAYQWEQSYDNGRTYTAIAGATNLSYQSQPSTGPGTVYYRVVVTSGNKTATSNYVSITSKTWNIATEGEVPVLQMQSPSGTPPVRVNIKNYNPLATYEWESAQGLMIVSTADDYAMFRPDYANFPPQTTPRQELLRCRMKLNGRTYSWSPYFTVTFLYRAPMELE